jgi:hypothetical protein
MATVTGFQEIYRALNEMPADIAKKLQKGAMKNVLQAMKADMQARAFGSLKGSIKYRTSASTKRIYAKLGSYDPLAHLMEFGWVHTGHLPKRVRPTSRGYVGTPGGNDGRGTGPHPFVRPAFDANAQGAIDKAVEAVKQALASGTLPFKA